MNENNDEKKVVVPTMETLKQTEVTSNKQEEKKTNIVASNTVQNTTVNETPASNKKVNTTTTVKTETTQKESAPIKSTIREVKPNTNNNEVVVEFNTKKDKQSNILFYILIAILIVIVFFVDDIVDLLTKDNYQYLNNITNEYSSNNLIDGYIKVNDKDSYVKYKKIKFYNFRQTTKGVITFDYVADKNISSPDKQEIYIELYNSDKQLIYKELFNPEKISSNLVSQYSMNVGSDVYSNIFYAKVLIYTKEEKNMAITVKCTYKFETANVSVKYINTYRFLNNELEKYDVSKSLTYEIENTDSEKYKQEIDSEYEKIKQYKIKNTYKDNLLKYTIDLNSELHDYTPLYEKGTIPYEIRKNEINKKWKCE